MTPKRNEDLWKGGDDPVPLVAALIGGSLLDLSTGPKTLLLEPLGDLFLNSQFTIVVPLVFATVSAAVAEMPSVRRLAEFMAALVLVFSVSGTLAAPIMAVAVGVGPPAGGVALPFAAPPSFRPLGTAEPIVQTFAVSPFGHLLSRRHMLPRVLFSAPFGVSLRMTGKRGPSLTGLLSAGTEARVNFVNTVLRYAPIGLGACFAPFVGDFGPDLIGACLKAFVVCHGVALACLFIAFTPYARIATDGTGLALFRRDIVPPAVTALGTQSSTAVLPVNPEAARPMRIPADTKERTLPIGATFHRESSRLSGVLEIAFLLGVFDVPFSGLGTYASAVAL